MDGAREGLAVAVGFIEAAVREAQIVGEAKAICEVIAKRLREVAAQIHNERLTDIELLLNDLTRNHEEPPDAERP